MAEDYNLQNMRNKPLGKYTILTFYLMYCTFYHLTDPAKIVKVV